MNAPPSDVGRRRFSCPEAGGLPCFSGGAAAYFFFDGGSNALRGAGIGGSMPDSVRRPADVQRTRGDLRECVTADPRDRQARRSRGASGTVNTETTMQRPGIALARGVGSFQRRRPAADVVPDVPPSRRRPLSSRPRGLTGELFRASRSASASAVVSPAYPRAFRGFCMLNQNRNALFHSANEGTVSSFGAPGGRALPFRSSSLLASS